MKTYEHPGTKEVFRVVCSCSSEPIYEGPDKERANQSLRILCPQVGHDLRLQEGRTVWITIERKNIS